MQAMKGIVQITGSSADNLMSDNNIMQKLRVTLSAWTQHWMTRDNSPVICVIIILHMCSDAVV